MLLSNLRVRLHFQQEAKANNDVIKNLQHNAYPWTIILDRLFTISTLYNLTSYLTIFPNSPHIQISARGILWVGLENKRCNTIVEKNVKTIDDSKQNLKITQKKLMQKRKKKHNIAYSYVTNNVIGIVYDKELMFCRYVDVRELCMCELLFWINTTLNHINMRPLFPKYEGSYMIYRP